ncbi:MAG: phospholipase D-like domain-containing protein [Pseudohongiellaceae bacterium]
MPPTFLITGFIVITSGTAVLHALLTKRDARAAFGWIAFCLFLPFFGPMTYLIFGINRIKHTAHKLYTVNIEADGTESVRDPGGTNLRPLSTVGENVTHKGLRSCDEVVVLENGESLYPAMLDAIRNANRKIYLSSYIIDNDSVGAEFTTALGDAQARGVDVRIIVDGLGEYMSWPRIGGTLRRKGLNFARFNPISVIPPALHVNMRNHRKIFVADGNVGFTGGQNIGTRHLLGDKSHTDHVSDLHFRFTGKIVDELERAFLSDWNYCRPDRGNSRFMPENENRTESEIWTRLVLDGPNEYLDRLNDLIVGVISAARSRVWIMTPYFLPGNDIVSALLGARLRGVDVKILLPVRSNIFLVNWATQNTLSYFIEKDIEIYHQPAPFAHAKVLLIDDHYALIGSANLDSRSLRLNFELGLEIFSSSVNIKLADYFLPRIQAATRVDLAQLRTISKLSRLRNALAWLFSPYL